MSGRDWLQYVTPGRLIGAILALGIASAWLVMGWPEHPHFAESQTIRAAQGDYQPTGAQCEENVLAKIKPIGKRQAQTDECAKRAEDHRIEQTRLAQEVRVTEATEEALRLAYTGAVSSLFQAVLLFLTLSATAWAAFAASEATRHAKASEGDVKQSIAEAAKAASAMEDVARSMTKSAAAAEASVEALKERTAQQMRAYVTIIVGGARAQHRGNGIRFEASPVMMNTGTTPARHVRHVSRAAIMKVPLPEDFDYPLDNEQFSGGAVLNPHQTFFMSAMVDQFIPDDRVAAVQCADGEALVVWGLIRFEDIFDQTQTVEFGVIYRWITDNDVVGHWTPRHNDAT